MENAIVEKFFKLKVTSYLKLLLMELILGLFSNLKKLSWSGPQICTAVRFS